METKEERAARLAALMKKLHGFYAEPWKLYHEPFHVAGPIYFVGNTYVSTFLLDEYTDTILPCARTFFTTLPQLFDHPSGSICHPAQ